LKKYLAIFWQLESVNKRSGFERIEEVEGSGKETA